MEGGGGGTRESLLRLKKKQSNLRLLLMLNCCTKAGGLWLSSLNDPQLFITGSKCRTPGNPVNPGAKVIEGASFNHNLSKNTG